MPRAQRSSTSAAGGPTEARASTLALPPLAEITDGERTIEQAEFAALVDRASGELADAGVGRGSRVAAALRPGPAAAILLWAAHALEASIIALDPDSPAELRQRAARSAGAGFVIEKLAVAAPGGDPPLDLAARPLDGAWRGGAPTSAPGGASWDAAPEGPPLTILRTSGTTGRPKLVPLWARQHLASARAACQALRAGSGDRWLCVLPLFHVGGLSILFRAAVSGAAVEFHERFDAERVAARLRSGEISHCSLVPTMLRRLLDRLPGRWARSLRCVLLGGSAVDRDLLERAAAAGIPVYRTYGMTETASLVALAGPGEEWARPLPGVELTVDPGSREILIRGEMVSPACCAADGWLRSGDLGELDSGGRLRVRGRLKTLIISGGENVSPEEVERTLESHPAVREAGVAGLPDREWGEAVVAVVVPAAAVGDGHDARVLGEALRAHCRAQLERYKVPKRIFFADALPRTALGKLDRGELARAARDFAEREG